MRAHGNIHPDYFFWKAGASSEEHGRSQCSSKKGGSDENAQGRAAKKAVKTRKLREVGKKATRTRKLRAAGKKAALTRKLGIRNARANGKKLGRPRRIVNADELLRLKTEGASLRQIASAFSGSIPAAAKALSVGLSNAYFQSLGLPTLIDGC